MTSSVVASSLSHTLITCYVGGTVRSNPFTYGNPISDPRRFFGREREVEQIFGRLRNEEFESSSVVGDRRIGKTSLLNFLANPVVRADPRRDGKPAQKPASPVELTRLT